MKAMSDEVIAAGLQGLPLWTRDGDAITRRFEFDDFIAAFSWMTRVAIVAEKMGHHPDWTNVYRTVEVRLSTHDAGGITESDFRLAAELDRLV